jgi:serine protease AprX
MLMVTTKRGRLRPGSAAAVAAVLASAVVAGIAGGRHAPGGPVPGAGGGQRGLSHAWSTEDWMGSTGSSPAAKLADIRTMIGASSGSAGALTGAGVGVALIDTGAAPVPGLPAAQVVNGPDLSFESQSPSLRYLDTYGHGTHMAGIIVGNDPATGAKGLAPKAKLTSIKVGIANGAVDVSQVIAALDWVVKHKDDDPANPIRVVNLSYGSGGTPPASLDPLQFAAEQAWRAGVVVVAAAGNAAEAQLSNPAKDRFVIAVGSASTKGTLSTADDDVSAFTNIGNSRKRIDVVAPGESVVSLRDPGSTIDAAYPTARSGDTLFRGSGTSQAAAATSAAVALLLQARPALTPDQVKALLTSSGTVLTAGNSAGAGYREVNVNAALATATPDTQQTWSASTGLGALEDARGSSHVVSGGVALTGENCIFGGFSSAAWAPLAAARKSWVGGVWLGYRMAGDGWTGSSWASKTWASATWSGGSWSGSSWTDPGWAQRFWSAGRWTTGNWSNRFWSSDDWEGTQ